MEEFNYTFAHPIIQEIQDGKHIAAPGHAHVQQRAYSSLLDRMHCVGLLYWRLNSMRLTRRTHYAY